MMYSYLSGTRRILAGRGSAVNPPRAFFPPTRGPGSSPSPGSDPCPCLAAWALAGYTLRVPSANTGRAAGCSAELARLLEQAASRSREIGRFYARLRARRVRELDRLFHAAHAKAFASVSCLQCAACCRSPWPRLTQADVRRLADHLSLRPAALAERYLLTDEDRDTVFRAHPCPFLLEDNRCSVYDARPRACREYPHTDQKGMQSLLDIRARNALLCPAVYLVTEELRRTLGF